MPRNRLHWLAFGLTAAAALLLSAVPGTSDVNVWNSWVDQLNTHGVFTGYNDGAGHIVHPPLGLLLLWATHNGPALAGIPAHVWPDGGITGFDLGVWLGLLISALLAVRITGCVWWGVLLLLAFLLDSVVYSYFDIWGFPFLLLALAATSRERHGHALAWAVLASLVKWQFLILLPFFGLVALRQSLAQSTESGHSVRSWRTIGGPLLPTAAIVFVTLLLFGQGIVLAFQRGLDTAILSGQALNLSWIITWAMHLRWPESYGPLEDGLIAVVRTRDTRVLFLVRGLFLSGYLGALWWLWRGPRTPETLFRAMLAGYVAFVLFNRGAHENHLAPAVLVAGYLAWSTPGWRWHATALAALLNINLFAFYDLTGEHRWEARRVWGVDYTLPLAVLAAAVLGAVLVSLLRTPSSSARRTRAA